MICIIETWPMIEIETRQWKAMCTKQWRKGFRWTAGSGSHCCCLENSMELNPGHRNPTDQWMVEGHLQCFVHLWRKKQQTNKKNNKMPTKNQQTNKKPTNQQKANKNQRIFFSLPSLSLQETREVVGTLADVALGWWVGWSSEEEDYLVLLFGCFI